MKKAWISLLLASLFVSTALVGCSSNQDAAKETPKQTDSQKEQNQPQAETPADPQSPAATHDDVKKVFNLGSEFFELPATAIPGLGMGEQEKLALDQKQSLELAKAISSGLGNSGWEQKDEPPGIFVTTDGKQFAIGMKKHDGSFALHSFELQADGTYKSVKQETKPAS